MINFRGELQEFYDTMVVETGPRMKKISNMATAVDVLTKQMSERNFSLIFKISVLFRNHYDRNVSTRI